MLIIEHSNDCFKLFIILRIFVDIIINIYSVKDINIFDVTHV